MKRKPDDTPAEEGAAEKRGRAPTVQELQAQLEGARQQLKAARQNEAAALERSQALEALLQAAHQQLQLLVPHQAGGSGGGALALQVRRAVQPRS